MVDDGTNSAFMARRRRLQRWGAAFVLILSLIAAWAVWRVPPRSLLRPPSPPATLAVIGAAGAKMSDVFVILNTHADPVRLTPKSQNPALITSRNSSPRLSPDGTLVCFNQLEAEKGRELDTDPRLVVARADGRELRSLGICQDFGCWSSSDGSLLYIEGYRSSGAGQLVRFDINANQKQILLNNWPSHQRLCDVAPDGKTLLCLASHPTGTGDKGIPLPEDIITTRIDGSMIARVTSTPEQHKFAARFSPRGDRVAFLTSDDYPNDFPHELELWVVDTDGSQATRLAKDIGGDSLCWALDGSGIFAFRPGNDSTEAGIYCLSLSDRSWQPVLLKHKMPPNIFGPYSPDCR